VLEKQDTYQQSFDPRPDLAVCSVPGLLPVASTASPRDVSTTRETETALHVGRVVDPSVREDGESEPQVQLALPPTAADRPASLPVPESPTDDQVGPGGAAESAGNEPGCAVPVEGVAPDATFVESTAGASGSASTSDRPKSSDASGPTSTAFRPSAVPVDQSLQALRDRELELIGTERIRLTPPVQPGAVDPRPRLSPGWTAVFAALLGLCAVATLIAIAIQVDKRPHEIATPLARTSAEVPAASPSGAPSAAPDRRPVRVRLSGPWRIHDAQSDSASRIIEGKVGLEPLVKTVEKQGVPLKQFYRVIAAFSKVRPLNNCAKSDRYIVLLDRPTKRIKAFEYITGNEDVYQAKEGADGYLSVQKLDLQVKQGRVAGAVLIGDEGLEAAMLAGGFEKALVSTLREALSGHAALEELDRGTRLRIIAQELTVLGEFARYTGIEALEIDYANDKQERIYYFVGSESRGYFDSSGRSPYTGGWRKPIPGAPITSRFNPHRLHPILKRVMPHEGTDFASPSGTPVGASSFGTVAFVGFAGPTGNFVRITHPGDIETGYAHLSRFAEGLKVGDKVKRLQVIGYVGSTGRSTGPHLHFSAKRAGKFIDPESLNLDGLRTLEPAERAKFELTKAEYNKLLEAIPLPAPLSTSGPVNPAPLASAEAGDELDFHEGQALPAAVVAPTAAVAVAAPPAASAASPASANAAPAVPRGNAVYLTDDELRNSQAGSDDGEVAE